MNFDWNQIWIFIGGWSLIGSAITWIIFAFTTMRKLDKAVVAEGMPRPCQWDPICGRAIWYTWPIIFSGKSFSKFKNRIIDTQIVKKNTNLFYWILALVLFLSTWTMVASVIIGWFFDFY